jgi:RNA polymerase sigma-70 factor (ECF subfamily)
MEPNTTPMQSMSPLPTPAEIPLSSPVFYGLEDLFRHYSSMVFRICLRYTKNREDAEDMVSEVFIKVGKGMADFRGEAKPMVWIYRIAVNHCLDHLRSRKSKNELDLDDLDTQSLRTLEGHGDRCLAKVTLNRILGKINPTTRRILFLSHVEGLTHGEIAKILGVTREAVTKKLHRFSEEMKRKEKGWAESGTSATSALGSNLDLNSGATNFI